MALKKKSKMVQSVKLGEDVEEYARLTSEELQEYILRLNAFSSKRTEYMAMGAYLDAIGAQLRETYNLPLKYNINLETGSVTEIEGAENEVSSL